MGDYLDSSSGYDGGTQGQYVGGGDSIDPSSPELTPKLQALAQQTAPTKFIGTGVRQSINPAWLDWQDNQRAYNNAAEDAQVAKDQGDYKQWQQTNLLKMAMQSQVPDSIRKDDTTGNLTLASQLKQGVQMAIDQGMPELALKFQQQANEYSTKALANKKDQYQVDGLKQQQIGDIFASVPEKDQGAWENAMLRLAGMGVQVPGEYMYINDPVTQAYIEKQSLSSKQGMAQMKFLQDGIDGVIKQKNAETRIAQADKREADKVASETAAREGHVADAGNKTQSQTSVTTLMGQLKKTSDKFQGFDSQLQPQVATLILNQKAMFQAQGQDPVTAQDNATITVLNRYDDKGNPVSAPSAPIPVAGAGKGEVPPAALAYLKAHPEAQDAFKAKYGYLP